MEPTLTPGDPGTPDHRGPWRYLRWLAMGQLRLLLPGIGWGVLWMLCIGLAPVAIGQAIDHGVAEEHTGSLLLWTGVLAVLGLIQGAATGLRHRLAVMSWLTAAYRTVQLITRQSTRLGATLSRRLSTGEVVSIGISDIAHIGDALDIVIRGSSAVVAIVSVTALMLVISPPLGLIVLAGVPLVLLIAAPLLRPYHRRQVRLRELVGDLNTRATDIVAGVRVLRGIGGEALFAERYREESQRVRRAGVNVARAESKIAGAEVLLPGLMIVAVTWLGARHAVNGTISVGQLVTFYGLAVFLVYPMSTLGEAADKLTKGKVAAGRVVRVLALQPELPCEGTVEPPADAELTDAISGLVVRPGLVTAVAAAGPADARAIADRLGHYARGEVTYGGVPLREVARLRERIVVSVNEDVLLSGRLEDMLTCGDLGRELARASRAAAADDIIDTVGLDARVAEAGREFSGGQQQRLRLARALAADPEVLVLVEPTSAVDAHTEARIADRLREARRGRTTVVCTTSPLVLDRADHVAYVEHGRVVAEGRHRELLDTRPRYAATVTRGEDGDRVIGGRT